MKAPRFDVLIIGFIQFWLKRRELLGKSIAFLKNQINEHTLVMPDSAGGESKEGRYFSASYRA